MKGCEYMNVFYGGKGIKKKPKPNKEVVFFDNVKKTKDLGKKNNKEKEEV